MLCRVTAKTKVASVDMLRIPFLGGWRFLTELLPQLLCYSLGFQLSPTPAALPPRNACHLVDWGSECCCPMMRLPSIATQVYEGRGYVGMGLHLCLSCNGLSSRGSCPMLPDPSLGQAFMNPLQVRRMKAGDSEMAMAISNIIGGEL